MKKKRRKTARRPLTEKQKQAAQLFFDAHGTGEIAAIVGVHRCTIWRWFQRKDFQRELRRIEKEWKDATRRRILKEMHESDEYKRQQAVRKAAMGRLRRAEKRLEALNGAGNVAEIRRALSAHTRAFDDVYGPALAAFGWERSSQKTSKKKRAAEPVKYVIKFI